MPRLLVGALLLEESLKFIDVCQTGTADDQHEVSGGCHPARL